MLNITKTQPLKSFLNRFEELQMEGTAKYTFELQFIGIHGPTLLVKFQGCQHDPGCLLVLIVGAHSLADRFFHRAGTGPLSE